MRPQFKILLFLACLNLAVGMVIALQLPGTAYVGVQGAGNTSDYEARFNATEIAEDWRATPFSGIPVVGDIFSGFYFLFSKFQFLIDGFPYLLTWIGDSYITSSAGRSSFTIIANVLRAVYAILMATFLVYLITGRDV